MNLRQLFQQHLAPTTFEPLAIQISRAEGSQLFDASGRPYIDLIGGISVCNVGHCHPKVVAAIKRQAEQYLHIMVYGELIETPQVEYAALLADHLPEALNCVYFTNSGAEAVEGAMKLAKRFTGRTEIVGCEKSYHGSTQGALSLIGDEHYRNAFRPLLPDVRHIRFGSFADLERITARTACVLLEPIQAEAGIIIPPTGWLQALRKRCDETGALLIFDEIQTGIGRTGRMWAFEHFDVAPDVLLSAKALGGGMPLGAFISSREILRSLAHDPILGHITTFGGHPVSCAAGKAAFELVAEELLSEVERKGQLFEDLLQHPLIRSIRRKGLMMAVELPDFPTVLETIQQALRQGGTGVFVDWFLFAPDCIRIVPPLLISEDEISKSCDLLLKALDGAMAK